MGTTRAAGEVRWAVAGLGWFAQVAILPAFAHAENARLVALFSSDRRKLDELGDKYDVEARHDYAELDDVLDQGGIDAIYLALPNHLHCEYTLRAARAGVHVLCEKPMAVTEDECERMIQAAEDNRIKLMIAYRLHFEEANLEALRIVRAGEIGEPRLFASCFGNEVTEPDDIRLGSISIGGGTLYDIGIYCINAARHLFGSEPTLVHAISASRNDDDRFRDADEMTVGLLRFANGGLATIATSFGSQDHDFYEMRGTEGMLRVEPAFSFREKLGHELIVDERRSQRHFAKRDQVAPELIHFSQAILDDTDPAPGGREGLADVRIIRALVHSAETGHPVTLGAYDAGTRPGWWNEMRRPPVGEQELVNEKSPSGD
jgi:glucose-fructose oxidoreductase